MSRQWSDCTVDLPRIIGDLVDRSHKEHRYWPEGIQCTCVHWLGRDHSGHRRAMFQEAAGSYRRDKEPTVAEQKTEWAVEHQQGITKPMTQEQALQRLAEFEERRRNSVRPRPAPRLLRRTVTPWEPVED